MKLRMRAIVLAASVSCATEPARAIMYCSEPSKPYCVDGSGYFDDQSDFERCKSEVESYVDDVRRLTDCLADEANDAVRESNEIVEKFNCRAQGRSYC